LASGESEHSRVLTLPFTVLPQLNLEEAAVRVSIT
jgi:hypothetical protein